MYSPYLLQLCGDFDAACYEASISTRQSEKSLHQLDDYLWSISEKICSIIEADGESELNGFRVEHFNSKVLRWCKTNHVIANLWEKPAGYSGDYRTIELICQNKPAWTRLEDIFLNHLLRSAMAVQHRAKVSAQAHFLIDVMARNGHLKLINAGCGPCFDLRLALDRYSPHQSTEVVLIDLDPRALDFSQLQLNPFSHLATFTFRCEDVLRSIRRLCAVPSEIGNYNAILFGGLFDYLPDRVIVVLLKATLRLTRPGGEIFFSQVSPDNPNRVFMKWYGDWILLERDEHALQHLCQAAGINSSAISFTREESGVAILARIVNQ